MIKKFSILLLIFAVATLVGCATQMEAIKGHSDATLIGKNQIIVNFKNKAALGGNFMVSVRDGILLVELNRRDSERPGMFLYAFDPRTNLMAKIWRGDKKVEFYVLKEGEFLASKIKNDSDMQKYEEVRSNKGKSFKDFADFVITNHEDLAKYRLMNRTSNPKEIDMQFACSMSGKIIERFGWNPIDGDGSGCLVKGYSRIWQLIDSYQYWKVIPDEAVQRNSVAYGSIADSPHPNEKVWAQIAKDKTDFVKKLTLVLPLQLKETKIGVKKEYDERGYYYSYELYRTGSITSFLDAFEKLHFPEIQKQLN